MAEFLSTHRHIVARIEDAIAQAKEYFYIIVPNISVLPPVFGMKGWEAAKRGAKVVLIYSEAEAADDELAHFQNNRISLFHRKAIKTCCYLNEKEGIVTSFNLFANHQDEAIDFGTYFKKTYAAEMYAALLKEFRSVWADAEKMVVADRHLMSQENWVAQNAAKVAEAIPSQNSTPVGPADKKLTVKEKQEVILKIFASEYENCTIKIEDAERLRIYGRGMVIALSNERVDLIFVHYDAYKSRLDELKNFLAEKNPGLKAWFQYNRINMQLESERDIMALFETMREAVALFSLA